MPDRYEILEKIAAGDFATVYRGRDRELGREVAIKQIHAQFLAEKGRLERYWQEAQLLASLEHPHVMTIYDLVRRRGQLIVELMRGSLKDKTQGQPLNLDYLRIALFHALQALKFLHSNGVIHGDIKPGNLLIDKRGRIKLGDFGMARRAGNEEGSLLKGTTKYMAPEVVSDQFGRVGPHSDLYSLGFSIYELLCGENFETLFPGLNAFGRDKQVAWMMWHAAADRRLPEIARVMEGVPPDLAHVIEKLCAKHPAQRYATADQALADLMRDPALLTTTPAAEDEPLTPTPAQRRKRQIAIGAFAASCLLSLGLLIPWGGDGPKAVKREIEPGRGVVRSVLTDENRLILEINDQPREVAVRSHDRIFLNDRASLLRQLREGDVVTLRNFSDETGRPVLEVAAFRPETARGKVQRVDADLGRMTMTIDEGELRGQTLPLDVPADARFELNGSSQLDGHAVTLADLRSDDAIEVTHVERETGRAALSLIAHRLVPQKGIVRAVDPQKRELTLAPADGQNATLWTLPIAEKCSVTINGRQFLDDKLLGWRDLKPGDTATVMHDTQIARVDAVRQYEDAGEIHAVKFDPQLIQVFLRGQSQSRDYRVGPECEITLGGEKVPFDALRRGDEVVVTHGTAEGSTPTPQKIAATRPVDRRRWALLIPIGKHDDTMLAPAPRAAANAALIKESLIKRHRVPADQTTTLADESFIRLEQGIPAFLKRVPADGQLTVYIAAQAFVEEGLAYLAPRDFNTRRTSATGLPMTWLVEQLEACPAREKTVLLDVGPAADTADSQLQPAAAELVERLQSGPSPLLLKTTTVIAANKRGQRDRGAMGGEHGQFASVAAAGFSGQADKNRDNRLEVTELFEFIDQQLAATTSGSEALTPVLFLPNSVPPPRISAEGKEAVRKVLANLGRSKVDLDTLAKEYEAAATLLGPHPEAKLAYALVLYKQRKFDEALTSLEDVRQSQPDVLSAPQLWSWIQFTKRNYLSGLTGLTQLATNAKPPRNADYNEETLRLFEWVGALREYATLVAGAGDDTRVAQQVARLDAAMKQQPAAAAARYEQGRKHTQTTWEDYARQIAAASSEDQPKLRLDSRLITSYLNFDIEEAQAQLQDRMNE